MAADILLMRSLTRLRQMTYQSHILRIQGRGRLSLAQNPVKEQVSVNLPQFESPFLKDQVVTLVFNHLNQHLLNVTTLL